MSEQAIQHVLDVKRRHEAELLRRPNVVAVGVGYRTRGGQATSEVCIVVSVTQKIPADKLQRDDVLPPTLEDVPIDVVASGVIRAW
jgi:hypothetical protein